MKHFDDLLGVVVYTFNPNIQKRQVYLYEFKVSVVNTVSSRLAGAI